MVPGFKNQLKQKNHKDGKQIRLQYDDMGNLTQKDRYWDENTKANTTKYTYTMDDQIATIETEGRTQMSAKYDPLRQRIMTTMPGGDVGSGTKWYYWANRCS